MNRGAKRLLGLAAGALAIACTVQLSSCSKDDGTHVYLGRLFIESRDCLGTTSSVDVVPGDDPGECPPICMIQPHTEVGRAVYVATECPPYPAPDFDFSGTDPSCAPALAARARNDTCLSDGGSTNPLPPPDAAADSD